MFLCPSGDGIAYYASQHHTLVFDSTRVSPVQFEMAYLLFSVSLFIPVDVLESKVRVPLLTTQSSSTMSSQPRFEPATLSADN